MYYLNRMKRNFRKEKDFLGERAVPADAYYGIHTQRALENFPISGLTNHKELIKAVCEIKIAVSKFCADFKVFDKNICRAVTEAATEIIEGKLAKQIKVDIFQAGAGTSLNMNINEVIANRANELLGSKKGVYKPVHPNDVVNFAQSTNDVIPAAMRIATIRVTNNLIEESKQLVLVFRKKATEFSKMIKAGRTHLRDATPVTVGSEFLAYGITIEKDIKTIEKSLTNLFFVGLSGTATGSGLNAPDGYKKHIIRYLNKETGLNLKKAKSLYEAMQNQGDFAHLMGAVNSFALNMIRITNDLRLLSSGPNTGFNEILLPEVQAGSSIMPGKINPSILEMFEMVCFFVSGMNQTVNLAVLSGQLELNVFMPLIANAVLFSVQYMSNAVRTLREKCVAGISVNEEVTEKYALKSLGIATILSPVLGYERVAALVKEANLNGKDILSLIEEKGLMKKEEVVEMIKSHLEVL